MPRFHLPALRRPEILGPSRRARWRRWALRRALAAACVAAATLLLVGVVRPPPPATTRVVVAAAGLPGGAVLGEDDLRVVRVESDPALVATVEDPRSLRRAAPDVTRGAGGGRHGDPSGAALAG